MSGMQNRNNRARRIAGKELARLAREQAYGLNSKHHGKETVWLLVVTDDTQPLGAKAAVSVFATEEDATRAMLVEINEEIAMGNIHSDDLEYSQEESFVHTNDRRFSYAIVESAIWRTSLMSKKNQKTGQ